ncbi:peptide ABC transporter substrate-binding protein [Oleisolibacter albus]|uniref:peptide ABC transporter substrate-binding protein n=1 Tax=Oleisolibacter albus TaxID=2171757 RepID=UPI0012D77F84|nr:peptide ABC transporter substrate-binding protein [Oleisolibacter albus]
MRVQRLTVALLVALWSMLAGGARAEMVLNLGLGPEVDSLDPHRSTTIVAGAVLLELWEGLTSFDAAGRTSPGVAARWDTSEDGLVWTFTLRPDARWSDGSAVTAEDFVAGWRRAVTPATGLALPEWVSPLKNAEAILAGRAAPETLGVRADGPQRLVVTLEHPKPDFLIYTAYWPLFPLHRPSLEREGSRFVQPGRLVGNGPFQLAEQVPQSHLRLVRNPHFHDAAAVKPDAVVFHVTEDQQTEMKRFRAGDLQVTRAIPPSQLDWAKANLPESVHLAYQISTFMLMPNLKTAPLGTHVEVRRALSLAIDREALVAKVTRGGEVPAYTLTPPAIDGYAPPPPDWAAWPQARRDEEARRLLAAAGFGTDRPLEVELLYNTSEVYRQVAVALAALWQSKLGVRTTLVNQEFKVVVRRIREQDWPGLVRISWAVPLTSEYLNLLRSRSRLGPGYADAAFDALMADADAAPTLERFHAALARAEAHANDAVPVIPILHQTSRRLVSPRVQGWVDNPLDVHPARYLSLAP